MGKLLTPTELASVFSVSRATVYNWIRKGCPYVGKARVKRFEYEDVKDWLTTQRITTTANEE